MPWPGLAARFPVLGYRDFRLLLADRLLAPAAFAFSMVGVSFAVLDVTRSTADLSYVLAAQILPALVFALAGGVFADRFAPQRVIVAANLMIAVGEGGFGLLVLAGQPRLWQMIALETLTGAGMAVFYLASQALLPRLVPDGLLQEASAMSRLAMNGAQMAGAAIAGLFVAATGPGGPSRSAGSACWARCHCCSPSARQVPSTPSATTCSASCAKDGRRSPPASGCGSPLSSTAWSLPPGTGRSTCWAPWSPGITWAARRPGA